MYQVLYRKWRPQVFEDVVGQPHITTTLLNELKAGRTAHAYLFTGSRGTGKTTCAKILSKAVNCLNPQNGDPCNVCENCIGIDNGSILDVVEIDAASNRGVENIRELREETNFTPAKAKYRVYIIDEVHMLTIEAFNALLKTLEEPPAYVVFILATTEVHKLPATILSRCQRFDFRRIALQDIVARLSYVAQQEKINLDKEAAYLIARIADGGMRDALSILDQASGGDEVVTTQRVRQTAGLAGNEHLFKLSDAIANEDTPAALDIVNDLHQHSLDMEQLCVTLIDHFRNFMMMKTLEHPEEVILAADDELALLKEKAKDFSLERIVSILDILQGALENMRYGAQRRIRMEMTIVRLTTPTMNTDVNAIIDRITHLENLLQNGEVRPKAQVATTNTLQEDIVEEKEDISNNVSDDAPPWDEEAKARASQEVKEDAEVQVQEYEDIDIPLPKDEDIATKSEEVPSMDNEEIEDKAPVASAGEELFSEWSQVLEALSQLNKPLCGILAGSNAFKRGDNRILIESPNPALTQLLQQSNHIATLHEAVYRVSGIKYRLGVYRHEEEQKENQAPTKDPLQDLFGRAKEADIEIEIE